MIVRIGIVIDGSLLGLDRSRSSLAYRIDDLGLNNGRHLFLRLAELTDGTADRAAHLRELIRAKQQKAEDHDDCQLTLSNTKHTYLQGSMMSRARTAPFGRNSSIHSVKYSARTPKRPSASQTYAKRHALLGAKIMPP